MLVFVLFLLDKVSYHFLFEAISLSPLVIQKHLTRQVFPGNINFN